MEALRTREQPAATALTIAAAWAWLACERLKCCRQVLLRCGYIAAPSVMAALLGLPSPGAVVTYCLTAWRMLVPSFLLPLLLSPLQELRHPHIVRLRETVTYKVCAV